jgi:hypothetical protein
MKLRFSIEQAKKLKEITLAAEKRRPTYDQLFVEEIYPENEIVYEGDSPDADAIDQSTLEPSFWFVKDHGIYLMSNGILNKDEKIIIYAENFDPRTTEDWYHHLDALNEELEDGSDFVIPVGLNWLDMSLKANPEAEWIEIEINKEQLALIL